MEIITSDVNIAKKKDIIYKNVLYCISIKYIILLIFVFCVKNEGMLKRYNFYFIIYRIVQRIVKGCSGCQIIRNNKEHIRKDYLFRLL